MVIDFKIKNYLIEQYPIGLPIFTSIWLENLKYSKSIEKNYNLVICRKHTWNNSISLCQLSPFIRKHIKF